MFNTHHTVPLLCGGVGNNVLFTGTPHLRGFHKRGPRVVIEHATPAVCVCAWLGV